VFSAGRAPRGRKKLLPSRTRLGGASAEVVAPPGLRKQTFHQRTWYARYAAVTSLGRQPGVDCQGRRVQLISLAEGLGRAGPAPLRAWHGPYRPSRVGLAGSTGGSGLGPGVGAWRWRGPWHPRSQAWPVSASTGAWRRRGPARTTTRAWPAPPPRLSPALRVGLAGPWGGSVLAPPPALGADEGRRAQRPGLGPCRWNDTLENYQHLAGHQVHLVHEPRARCEPAWPARRAARPRPQCPGAGPSPPPPRAAALPRIRQHLAGHQVHLVHGHAGRGDRRRAGLRRRHVQPSVPPIQRHREPRRKAASAVPACTMPSARGSQSMGSQNSAPTAPNRTGTSSGAPRARPAGARRRSARQNRPETPRGSPSMAHHRAASQPIAPCGLGPLFEKKNSL
jgi:hypothetical protein